MPPKVMKKNDFTMQSIIVKNKSYKDANKIASDITSKGSEPFNKLVRETKGGSLRFRVTPKTKYQPKSFKTVVINKDVSVVFGHLK